MEIRKYKGEDCAAMADLFYETVLVNRETLFRGACAGKKEIWYCSGVSIRQCGILNLKDIVKDNP